MTAAPKTLDLMDALAKSLAQPAGPAVALKLYDHADALLVVDAWLAEHEDEIARGEGELPPELDALLAEADASFDAKAANVGLYIRSLLATAEAIKTETDRLARRRKAFDTTADKLKAYLCAQMQRVGKTKIKHALATLSVIPTERVECTLDESDLRNLGQGYPGTIRVIPEKVELVRAEAKKLIESGALENSTLSNGIRIVHDSYVKIT